MAFSLPTFNLTVDIYTGPWPVSSPRLSSPANWAFGRRVQQPLYDINAAALQPSTFANLLLLPALTDIRSGLLVVQPDFVQIPAGSGRWYQVVAVDDIGKGFPNEHRAAQCMQVSVLTDAGLSGLLWPVPMP